MFYVVQKLDVSRFGVDDEVNIFLTRFAVDDYFYESGDARHVIFDVVAGRLLETLENLEDFGARQICVHDVATLDNCEKTPKVFFRASRAAEYAISQLQLLRANTVSS